MITLQKVFWLYYLLCSYPDCRRSSSGSLEFELCKLHVCFSDGSQLLSSDSKSIKVELLNVLVRAKTRELIGSNSLVEYFVQIGLQSEIQFHLNSSQICIVLVNVKGYIHIYYLLFLFCTNISRCFLVVNQLNASVSKKTFEICKQTNHIDFCNALLIILNLQITNYMSVF